MIKSKYSQLSQGNRQIIRTVARLEFEDSQQESPILVAVNGERALEFAKDLHQLFHKVQNYTGKASEPIIIENDTSRAELFENLKTILTEQKHNGNRPRTAVLANVDKLEWDAILVIHAFADHLSYPVPNALIFLTSNFGIEDNDHCEQMMTKKLHEHWTANGGTDDNEFEDSQQESPILVAVNGERALEFAKDLHQLFHKVQNYTGKASEPIIIENDTSRAELFENLKTILTEQKHNGNRPRTAVLANVDKLEWDAILVIHAFADHLSYPVPNALIFLTSNFGIEDNDHCEQMMTKKLHEHWTANGGTDDNVPPIIARISYFSCI
ncbi:unnamed protein product [Caenorhabditis bovis]|uniref:Uncharacterized protein n=1 Tax=Caenorhabditis bovis TaxID=2654633 RepID=A0A8S1F847_9PELO|nr:unnamed protein product [Caenorhabditis bovis]